MAKPKKQNKPKSAFDELGLGPTVKNLIEEIQELYLCDQIPWVVGYSGGKDSSAILQLVWLAVSKLSEEQRKKQIHVISTDTLVEQPVVSAWVDASHAKITSEAEKQKMPITAHKLTPAVEDSFWVNLIGKGYPKPNAKFRWCTSRMKINPSNRFIRRVVKDNGEALLVLGTRKAESQRRAKTMSKHEKHRYRDKISPNAELHNSNVYTPIEDWINDDVWLFLMQVKNPWGFTNKSLLGMYQGASDDNECPLVVDTSTPSCGSSRFGCWVCTVVDKDRSMEAMIKNDDEKLWMDPLLKFRNSLGLVSEDIDEEERAWIGKKRKDKLTDDEVRTIERKRRDFRRIDGRVQLFRDKTISGPYKREYREKLLRWLLEIQRDIQENGPKDFKGLELITIDELREIRDLWLEKGQFDDSVPKIYEEVFGKPLPVTEYDDRLLDRTDWEILQELCDGDEVFFELQTRLLNIEREYRGMTRRAGIYEAIEKQLKASQFASEEEAIRIRTDEKQRRDSIVDKQKPEPYIQQSLLPDEEGSVAQ